MAVIHFKQDDQRQAVKQIFKIIEHKAPIYTVSRFINSFHKVMSCRRNNNNEKFPVFVSSFLGLSSEHFMNANETSSSPV